MRSLRWRTLSSAAGGSGKKLAFLGVGNMGYFMAKNLIEKSGYHLTAFDVSSQALRNIEKAGATVADSPGKAAQDAAVVVTMLPSNEAVLSAYEGVFSARLDEDCLCIDSSTVDPKVSRQVAQLAKENRASFIDAPVSGGVGGAQAATLTFMVGGSEENFARSKDILRFMGKNIVHCGDVGTGEIAKLCNNLVLAISMIGVSEAMNLGTKLGIDAKTLANIMNTSSARCWSGDTYNPYPGVMEGTPSSNGYKGGFATSLMLKDLGLVLDAAKSHKVPLPLGESSHAFYEIVRAHGLGDKDFSVACEFLNGRPFETK